MAESSGSSLSSIASDDISDHDGSKQALSPAGHHANNPGASANANVPPSKKRRTGAASWDRNTTPVSTSLQDDIPPVSPSASISSDTSGEISNSPYTLALLGGTLEDDYSGQGNDQVTTCRWEGCDAGVLGNMDNLVNHIHNEHIGSRQKKYSCEWADCNRKGQTHASGYALRAHMRSHTREKPFYCSLPECDRSFTRSDALTKHMRTVHEAEALRPLETNPKAAASLPLLGGPAGGSGGALPASKLQRIKLKLSHPPKDDADRDSEIGANDDPSATTATSYLHDLDIDLPDIGFDEHELALRPHDLYRLLRRQIYWAERESERLREEWDLIQPKRKQAWLEKEAVLERWLNDEMEFSAAYSQIKRKRDAREAKAREEESSQQPPPITVTNGSETHVDQYGDRDRDQDLDEDQDPDQLQQRRDPSQNELVDLEVQRWAREFQERQHTAARQASVAKSNSADSKPGIIPRPAGAV